MRYLITGGAGFLGSNLAHAALGRGEELCVLDDLSRHGSRENLAWLEGTGDFRFLEHDIRNVALVSNAVQDFRPDVVFHLAGQVAMATSLDDPRADFEINALGTINVLEAVRAHAPNALVTYSSTNKVYGDLEWARYDEGKTRYTATDHPEGFDETTPLEFHSPYGCSKGAADQYMLDYARMYGLNTVVFRHSSMYGARQFATFEQGWIGWFCQKALETKSGVLEEPFTIAGNGKQVRDVLHFTDLIALYFAVVESLETGRGRAFNIGGGMSNSLSLLELFGLLEENLGVTLSYKRLAPRESDQKVFVADNARAWKAFRWKPAVDAQDGIRGMLDWTVKST